MKRVFVRSCGLVVAGCLTIHAQDASSSLDDLLSQYRSNADLSNETKQESAGSVTVFTREQLEKMQAYNLRDILKTVPGFTMQETASGQATLTKAKGSTFNSQFLKLYINDHEVSSIGYGSAMMMWGYLDISYIDHIEIYQTGSSVMAGDEPPGIVVRLYSKDPEREDGGAFTAMGGSRGSNEFNAYYAYKGSRYSAFAYADTHTENRKSYDSGRSSSPIQRDFTTTNFFASLQGDDFTIDAAQFRLESDRLFGLDTNHTPLDNNADLIHRYLVGTKYFQDKTLKIRLAYDNANHKHTESDLGGISLYNRDGTLQSVNAWHFNKSESILDAVADKQFLLSNHDIHTGVQTKYRKVTPNSLITDGNERVDEITGPTRWDTYSVFVSDDVTLDEHNLVFANFKLDHYNLNGGGEDFNDYVIRLGHVYNDGKWLWKNFAVRTYGYPVFLQTTYFPFITKSNSHLKSEERIALSTEVTYKTSATNTSIRLIYNTAKDAISLQNNAYINSSATPEFYSVFGSHEIRFGQDHRLSASAYYGNDDMPLTQSSQYGGLIQLFDTFGAVDVYNELLYRSGYHYFTPSGINVTVKEGYDYTLGITYHATKDLSFFAKGENLLNKAIVTPYPMPTYVDYIAPFDRTFRAGLKYVF